MSHLARVKVFLSLARDRSFVITHIPYDIFIYQRHIIIVGGVTFISVRYVLTNMALCYQLEFLTALTAACVFVRKYILSYFLCWNISLDNYDETHEKIQLCLYVILSWFSAANLGLYSLRRHSLIVAGIPIINLRRSSDRLLRYIMGIPGPARRPF